MNCFQLKERKNGLPRVLPKTWSPTHVGIYPTAISLNDTLSSTSDDDSDNNLWQQHVATICCDSLQQQHILTTCGNSILWRTIYCDGISSHFLMFHMAECFHCLQTENRTETKYSGFYCGKDFAKRNIAQISSSCDLLIGLDPDTLSLNNCNIQCLP